MYSCVYGYLGIMAFINKKSTASILEILLFFNTIAFCSNKKNQCVLGCLSKVNSFFFYGRITGSANLVPNLNQPSEN